MSIEVPFAMKSSESSQGAQVRQLFSSEQQIVFVSGNFNIVHPGHLRLLQFAAECGDALVVGVHRDGYGNTVVPAELRLESVQSIGSVTHAFVLQGTPEDFIRDFKPTVVVKGKEHETRFNPEKAAVESYGGQLIYSSGDVRFSSLDLLQQELSGTGQFGIRKPQGFADRHGFSMSDLAGLVEGFSALKVVVIGDLIVDEYITCDPLGMSHEDPTLVVTPLKRDKFVGGAGIVAAHACGLGADVTYYSVVGADETAQFATKTLANYGVRGAFLTDETRPTTLKQRFRAGGKTLLRVSHLKQHDISAELTDVIVDRMAAALKGADLLIFSDFNYGCLPQPLVDRISEVASDGNVMMVADSQASSQMGDVSRFKGMTLVTPTEREARLATLDHTSGLVVLAETLRQKSSTENVIITLGAEGILIHAPETTTDSFITDRLPAMNQSPKDFAGAGDTLLTCSALALASGASVWQGAYLGSVAAARQVGRVGNQPLTASELIEEVLR